MATFLSAKKCYMNQNLCLRAPVALSTASAGHMEERVQLKLKPTTYIKYKVDMLQLYSRVQNTE